MKPYVVCHMVASIDGRLIDEISLAICPAVDGAKGAPSVFDSADKDSELRAPVAQISLESCEALEGGAVWLRYRVRNGAAAVPGDSS